MACGQYYVDSAAAWTCSHSVLYRQKQDKSQKVRQGLRVRLLRLQRVQRLRGEERQKYRLSLTRSAI